MNKDKLNEMLEALVNVKTVRSLLPYTGEINTSNHLYDDCIEQAKNALDKLQTRREKIQPSSQQDIFLLRLASDIAYYYLQEEIQKAENELVEQKISEIAGQLSDA